MKNTPPKSAEVSAGSEMGVRRVAKPEVSSNRAKPREPTRRAVVTSPVIENMPPSTLGIAKKRHVAVIRNDPGLKVLQIQRNINPQLTNEQTKAKSIAVAPDVLSLSAQLAPWVYMSSTLEAALQGSETRLKVRRTPFSIMRVPTTLFSRKR